MKIYEIGDIVQIVSNTEWNGLYGIVEYKDDNILKIFCTTKTMQSYIVHKDNIDDITLYEKRK